MGQNNKGGALVYILIAVALMAALAYTIARDSSGGQQLHRLKGEKVTLFTSDLMSHVTAIEQSFFQMQQFGANIDTIRFDKSGDGGYTSNTNDQIYHPAGGGVQPFKTPDTALFDGVGTTGFVFQSNANVEWTTTTATDLIFSFINLNGAICAELNKKMKGSTTIPSFTGTTAEVFVEGGTDAPFLIAECAACEDTRSLCVNDGTTNIYYTIIGSH